MSRENFIEYVKEDKLIVKSVADTLVMGFVYGTGRALQDLPEDKYARIASFVGDLGANLGIAVTNPNFLRWQMSDVAQTAWWISLGTLGIFMCSKVFKDMGVKVPDFIHTRGFRAATAISLTFGTAMILEAPQIAAQGTADIYAYLLGIGYYLSTDAAYQKISEIKD